MYLKLKQHPFFFILIGRFSKVFQKFKRAPMLHFQYVFTEIMLRHMKIKGVRSPHAMICKKGNEACGITNPEKLKLKLPA